MSARQPFVHLTAAARPPVASPGAGPEALLFKLDKLTGAYSRLHHELQRSTERLRIIFEITDRVAPLRNPGDVRDAILNRYGGAVGAARVLLHNGEAPQVLHDGGGLAVDDAALCARIGDGLEAVRAGALPGAMMSDLPVGPARVHVLLGRLPRTGRRLHYDVVLGVRPVSSPEFDIDDRLASETLLTYGSHLLFNLHLIEREADAALHTVRALAAAIDARDAYTHGHSERVGWLARELGQALGRPEAELPRLEWAGLLHDVGKIGVPEGLLTKVGRLSAEEHETLRRHAQIGYDVLSPVQALADVAEAILHHHEDWDGSGYPAGLAGPQIPLFARILRICDTFDAMTSQRTYGRARSVEQTLTEISELAGSAFDPDMTGPFVRLVRNGLASGARAFKLRFAHVS